MPRRVISAACAIGLFAAFCTVSTPGSTQAHATKQAAGKKAKKPGKKTVAAPAQPAARGGTTDRSVMPELHDARHGY